MGQRSNPFGSGGWTPDRIGTLTDHVVVITGANSGTGFEATDDVMVVLESCEDKDFGVGIGGD